MNNSLVKTLVMFGLAAVVAGVGAYYLLRSPGTTVASAAPRAEPPVVQSFSTVSPPPVRFVDITESAGIDFVHTNGSFGLKLLPETMGSGCAFFDYDVDGDADLLLINSRWWDSDPERAKKPPPTPALYQNDGHGRFKDVTAEVGLNVTIFGMGAAVGDYDNDGYPDLFVTAIDQDGNRLFHNEGGRKFRDVTAGDLAARKNWSTGAAFLDANNDAKLDLFVCSYVQWTPETDLKQDFQIAGVGRAFGPPLYFNGTFCQLFLGDGTGNFRDVSQDAGVQRANPNTGTPMGKSLGVVTCDLDDDGWTDVVVANDTVQNFLFRNKGQGVFEEVGAESGIAFDVAGNARGAMGVDVAAYRDDGAVAIAIGNFSNEMTALYVSQGSERLLFADRAIAEGVGPASLLLLKFAVFFFDYDLDGRPDLFTANGHLEEDISKVQASQTYAQPPQLFWNCGPEQRVVFVEVKREHAGADLFEPLVGRGAAYADIDGDGDLDVLITANGGRPRLLRNDGGNKNHWLRVVLEGDGVQSNRTALGTRVEVKLGGRAQRQELMGGRSYLSQSEQVLSFGLGESAQADEVVVTWPNGAVQKLTGVPSNQVLRVKQASTAEATESSGRPTSG